MTRDEIVTALRCCGNIECMKCRLQMNGFDTGTCRQMYTAAADLIENQQRRIEELLLANDGLLDTVLRTYGQIEKLAADRKALLNELCQYCGKYKKAHEGACDGCKWREL